MMHFVSHITLLNMVWIKLIILLYNNGKVGYTITSGCVLPHTHTRNAWNYKICKIYIMRMIVLLKNECRGYHHIYVFTYRLFLDHMIYQKLVVEWFDIIHADSYRLSRKTEANRHVNKNFEYLSLTVNIVLIQIGEVRIIV